MTNKKTYQEVNLSIIQTNPLNPRRNFAGPKYDELVAHDPDYMNTYLLPVTFEPDSEKKCDRWLSFLLENVQTPEAINQLQEFAGYCLERHTKYQKCLFLLGPGADGKSTFLATLQALIGRENCAAVSFQDLEQQFHRSSLFHKLLNISTEVGAAVLESPFFKAITTGDTINAAFKMKDVFEFQPYCKLVFAGHQLPRSRDNSYGFFRRWLPVKFKKQFREDDPARDPNLLDKFMAELPEIFYWAICGLQRLREQGMFTNCEETKAILMDYRRSNNPVMCFVEDECDLEAEKSTDKIPLYSHYKEYCKEGGYMALNRDNFFRELLSAVSNIKVYRPKVDGKRENHIKGIVLRSEMRSEEGK